MPNKLPKASKLTISGSEDQLTPIVLSGSDPDGSITGYTLTSLPSSGTLYLDLGHTQLAQINVTYTSNTLYFLPNANFSGDSSFTYTVRDNQNAISPSAAFTISVAAVNDAPVLDLNGAASGSSTTLNYVSVGSKALIAPSANVTDIDSANFGSGTLRVSITQNRTTADQLSITTDSTLTIANGSVFVSGTKIGSIIQNGSNGSELLINLANGATPAAVSILIEHVAYSNSSANASTPPRTVTFTVVDGDGTTNGGTDTSSATATINFAPPPPVDDGDATVTISGSAQEDSVLTANFANNDPDGAATAGPSYQWYRDGGAIGGATGSTYTLGDADVSHAITVRVSYTDGQGFAETITSAATAVVANVNDAPTGSVTISGTATEDQVLTASNTLADADGLGTITYHWLRGGVDTGATGTTYTLGDPDVGAQIRVRAVYTDGRGTAEAVTSAATTAVANVNDAPTLANAISNQAATEDSAFSFTLPTNTFNDADVGDTLTLSATLVDDTPLPGWLTFNAATGKFTGTPLNDDVETLSVKVTARDGSNASVSDVFDIVVANTNDPPVAVQDHVVTNEETVLTGNVLANNQLGADFDPDGDTLTVVAINGVAADVGQSVTLPSGATVVVEGNGSFTFDPRGAFDFVPANAGSADSFTYTISDGHGGSSSALAVLSVSGVNDAPTLANAISNQAATEDSAFSFTLPTNTFNDADVGDTLTLSATLVDDTPLPGWLTFNAATGKFTGTPLNDDVETLSVKVTARDGSNASVSDVFDIVVANTNDPPVAVQDHVVTNEETVLTGNVLANNQLGADFDPDGDTLTVVAINGVAADVGQSVTLPSGATVVVEGNGSFTFDPRGAFDFVPANAGSADSFTYTISDGHGGSSSALAVLSVSGVNDAPTLANAISNQAATEDSAFSFTLPTNTFNDVDVGDQLTLSATRANGSPLPSWLHFDASTGAFTGTPANGDVGTISVKVTATDGSNASASSTFSIAVANTNDAPTLVNAITDQTATEDSAFGFTVPAITFNDVDVGDQLTLSATRANGSPLPSWLHFDASTGAFTGTPANGDVGTISVKVTATDGSNALASSTFSIAVANTNDAPTDLNLSSSQIVENLAGATVGLLSVNDPDAGDTATYSIRPGFDGALFAIAGNELRVGSAGLDYEASPTRSVTVRATDSAGAFIDRTFTVNVLDRAEFTLTSGADVPPPSANNTQFIGTATTLNSNDNLDGGLGTDSLVLYGGGTFNLNSLAGYTGIEQVQLVNFTSSGASLFLRNGTTSEVTVLGDGFTDVILSGTATATSIQGADGTNQVEVLSASSWNPSITINGGNGFFDYLFLSPSNTTLNLQSATLTNVEYLYLGGSNLTALIDADAISGFTTLDGNSTSRFITADGALDLSGKSVTNATIQSTNATGTIFTVTSSGTAFQVFGGPGSDTIQANFAFTAAQRDAIFATTSIETIIDTTATYMAPAPDPNVFKLTAGADVLLPTAAGLTINGNATTLNSNDNLDGGLGTDSLVLYGGGTFNLNSLAGYTGIEQVQLVNFTSSGASLFLRNGTTSEVTVLGDGFTDVILSGTATATSIQGADGTNQVEVLSASSWNPSITINGGNGFFDYLFLSPSNTTLNLQSATLTNVEYLYLGGSNLTALIDADAISGFTTLDGNSTSRFITADGALDLSGKSVTNATIQSTNATGTIFTVTSSGTAFQVFGGPGSDTIQANFAFTAAQRDAIFATTSIETIIDTTATYMAPAPDPNVFKLTAGADVLLPTAAGLTINGNATTLNSNDNLDGGLGTDSLVLYGGGTFNLNSLAGYTGIEQVQLVNFTSSGASLFLRNGTTSEVTVLGDGFTDVILSGTATATSIQGADGTNQVEVLSASSWNPSITINGGNGFFDYLFLSPSNTTLNLQSATLTNVEYLYLGGSNLTALIDADAISGFTTLDGNSTSRFITADGALDLSGKSVTNATIQSTDPTGTIFTVTSSGTAFQVFGGPGSDTIQANFAFTAAQRDAIFASSSIELIHDITGFYGDDTNNTVNGTAAADNIQGGGGADRLIGSGGPDSLAGGAGADTFVFNLPSEGFDTVSDFVSGTDKLEISASGFGSGMIPDGTVLLTSAAEPLSGSSAGAGFLFDNSGANAGTVYWDANGGSASDAIALVQLQGVTSLLSSDFHLV